MPNTSQNSLKKKNHMESLHQGSINFLSNLDGSKKLLNNMYLRFLTSKYYLQ